MQEDNEWEKLIILKIFPKIHPKIIHTQTHESESVNRAVARRIGSQMPTKTIN